MPARVQPARCCGDLERSCAEVLKYFAAVLADLGQSPASISVADLLVGVAGFEAATSSSRTTVGESPRWRTGLESVLGRVPECTGRRPGSHSVGHSAAWSRTPAEVADGALSAAARTAVDQHGHRSQRGCCIRCCTPSAPAFSAGERLPGPLIGSSEGGWGSRMTVLDRRGHRGMALVSAR
jgi:hypothetical protein